MKNQKRTKKRNPRSEAAMREAIRNRAKLMWEVDEYEKGTVLVTVAEAGFPSVGGEAIAIFDLRDCFRKRSPLRGITKKLRKAIQPKRSRK